MESQGQRPGAAPTPDDSQTVFWRNRATALFDRFPMPLAFCDAHGTILTVNPAMAAEWGTLPGQLSGRGILDLFHPKTSARLHAITEAIRLRRRSRYPIEVSWTSGNGAGRHGEMTVDLIGDAPYAPPNLLLLLRVMDERPGRPADGADGRQAVSTVEARILALAAGGSATARIASAVGLTVDGVNYHFAQLSRRWGVAGKAALVARAYVTGVLAPRTWPPVPAPETTDPRP